MDVKPKRRRSREYPPTFSALIKLKVNAALFIRRFDRHKPRMRQIVDELQDINAKLKDAQQTSKTGATAGAATLGAGAGLALLAAPFTGGLSLVIFGAASAGSLAGDLAFREKRRKTEEESVKKLDELTKEFRKSAASLRSELEDIMSACGELWMTSSGAESFKFGTLLNNIQELISFTTNLRTSITVHCITEAVNKYKKAFEAFEKLKSELQHILETQ